MTTVENMVQRFARAWGAGERPDVEAYLAQVPPAQRDELAERLGSWLALAPTPDYSEQQLAEIAASPLVARILAHAEEEPAAARGWRVVLPSLRDRAGLALGEVARRLVPALGLPDGDGGAGRTAAEPRVAHYLERMEREDLDAERVSQRVLDALGDLLGTTGAALAQAARASVPRPALRAAAAPLFRAEDGADASEYAEDLAALIAAARTPAPDEVDRLFTGGRDA